MQRDAVGVLNKNEVVLIEIKNIVPEISIEICFRPVRIIFR